MSRGPAPTPTALKRLKGFPGKRKKEYCGEEPEPELGYPVEPDHIKSDPIAHAEWVNVCEQLDGMSILAKSDRAVIELYCVAYSQWRQSLDYIRRFGNVLKTPNNSFQISPYNTICKQNAKQVKDCLQELGLTPASRARMRVVKHETQVDAKWKGLIAV